LPKKRKRIKYFCPEGGKVKRRIISLGFKTDKSAGDSDRANTQPNGCGVNDEFTQGNQKLGNATLN